MFGNNWGHAFFQPRACDFCDDIMAETADIAFGDAWLPQYESIWQGTNLVVVRNRHLQDLLNDGVSQRSIVLEDLSTDAAATSQDGNYRHRWDGLSVRLRDEIRRGGWVPRKRIQPGSRRVPWWRRRIVRLREKICCA
ncbi:MAG: Coenzyme F420 hydrogenase/dehydrogenase, beta subunit C-terminal domain [Betaproteobacteria bacterium]|nr:Coenzyme F420 hydrogenase/dehydrogenase, beta subunit C-terminal domain [Betaproteobacteria bacterium]